MMRLFAISRNAFIETIRQPIYGILILVTFGVLVIDLPLSTQTMGKGAAEYKQTDTLLLVNLGLSTLLMSGLLLAAFSAGGVLAREIEDRTILTVVSKPVSRPVVVLGKFLGVSAALTVAYYLGALVLLGTVRHGVMPTVGDPFDWPVIVLGGSAIALAILAALWANFSFGWSFASTAVAFALATMTLAMAVVSVVGKGWKLVPFMQDIPPELLVAILLILLGVLVFAAVAIAASTRLGQVMTLLACFGFFFVGSMSQYLFGRFAQDSFAANLGYALWPNLTFYYPLDAMLSGQPISAGYLLLATAYAVCNIVAILALGMALFQRRELEVQDASDSAPRLVSLLAWLGRAAAVGAGLAALVLPSYVAGLRGAGLAVGLLLAAVLAWVYWGLFGRGIKWAWWLLLAVSGLGLLAGGADLVAPASLLGASDPTLVLAAVGCGATVLFLLLPKTRYHFGFVKRRKK